MATQSTIEWTESTWNPVSGCTKINAGCGKKPTSLESAIKDYVQNYLQKGEYLTGI